MGGETWITAVHASGDAQLARLGGGATLRLHAAGCLARHTRLAYATTVHRARGMTVDRAHATIDAATTRPRVIRARGR